MGGDNATVAVEFQRPGGAEPFALPRVVEPAYGFPAQLQPQADGVPGFRFGIEVIGTDADRELHRLALVLDHLLAQHAAQQQPGSRTA